MSTTSSAALPSDVEGLDVQKWHAHSVTQNASEAPGGARLHATFWPAGELIRLRARSRCQPERPGMSRSEPSTSHHAAKPPDYSAPTGAAPRGSSRSRGLPLDGSCWCV